MTSQQDWHGIKSSKFNYTEKVHLRVQDQMVDFQGNTNGLGLGRKHFDEINGVPSNWKPSLVTNVPKPGDGQSREFLPGKKNIHVTVTEKKPRPEMMHLREGKSGHLEDLPYGIRTNNDLHTEKHYEVDQTMGRKKRLEYLSQMRNGLNLVSLGDKIYKNPIYATDFFKEGGLIAGSTQVQKKVNINQLHEKEMEQKLKLIQSQIRKGTKWTDRLKIDADQEKKKDIDELDTWMETILKPSNPNYQDPEKFFENLEKQQQVKQPANAKKAGKK